VSQLRRVRQLRRRFEPRACPLLRFRRRRDATGAMAAAALARRLHVARDTAAAVWPCVLMQTFMLVV
jgi:hypothetical protein